MQQRGSAPGFPFSTAQQDEAPLPAPLTTAVGARNHRRVCLALQNWLLVTNATQKFSTENYCLLTLTTGKAHFCNLEGAPVSRIGSRKST